ncbi:serine/threonine-protein kinase [Mesoterricola sediminis]|uniref:Protein kinase domain-containing protein n=1 Tax=Mesoterricola sediminis TaxID=2927980 RepID=A0AA48GRM3_9BACT|nr:serine/threonine-protein kinase [Mesoterricola sediminis]BDU76344.1 hypothetical protein METESE_13020 [Mesoterricola sediminis]
MNPSLLLIVDGESFRTPDVSTVLGGQGWRVVWVQGVFGFPPGAEDLVPDVVLLDPAVLTSRGAELVRDLCARKPGLPLVVLGDAGDEAGWAERLGLGAHPFHRLGRDASIQAWPATLQSCLEGFGTGAAKLTAEDIFGDILAEIESPLPAAVRSGSLPELEFLESTQVSDPGQEPAAPEPPPPPVPPPPPPVPAPSAQDPGLEEFGNYYLLEKVAVGGMAELFKARQRGVHDFEKIVAIKRILPHLSDNDEFVRMFIDEAKLAAQLTHPNIAQIFDLGKAMGFYYIAMEFVDGRDLRSLLRKVRDYRLPVPEPIAAAITMKVASALDYAHRKRGINDKDLKLVHRDISPQNILISYEGAVKLVDFGIAKAATKSTQTMAGALKGKLLYMSPEQALGQALDGRSDIYSLGLVLFELLTGERCFQADSELGVLEKVRMGKVQELRAVNPGVSTEMASIVGKALQRDPDHRYLSARFLERDLKSFLTRTDSEPTEHDVAEYVNAVLKGSRADLEALLTLRYPRPEPAPTASGATSAGTAGTAPGLRPAAQAPGASSPSIRPAAPAAPPARPAPPPRPSPVLPPPALAPEPRSQPYWLIPVVIALIAGIAWVAFRAFS